MRGVNRALDRVRMEIDEVGIGRVVSGQQSFLSKPETVVATEVRLELFTVGVKVPEVRKTLHGEGVDEASGRNGRSHAMTAEDDHLLKFGIIAGLSREKGNAAER